MKLCRSDEVKAGNSHMLTKCLTSSNKCHACSNKKLVETSATLQVWTAFSEAVLVNLQTGSAGSSCPENQFPVVNLTVEGIATWQVSTVGTVGRARRFN